MIPDDNQPTHGYALSGHGQPIVQPLNEAAAEVQENPAADVIRQKLEQIFSGEPPAEEERQEVTQLTRRSKHQEYMFQLSNSGRPMAEIQTAWHAYYAQLPESEKHEVWQEFYAAHEKAKQTTTQSVIPRATPQPKPRVSDSTPESVAETSPFSALLPQDEQPLQAVHATMPEEAPATPAQTRQKILETIRKQAKAPKKQHAQSLAFGLTMGIVMVGILSFGFFNERFIAPFVTPSRAVSSTPIIIDPTSGNVSTTPEIIIPKINVQIPVIYDVTTIQESEVQKGLERGVVHYVTTPLPGQKGNGVIFGHSANNILNHGRYKFAFVLLKKLDIGDTFYINKDGKRYVYRIYEKKIVPPTDISVLNPKDDKPATFTLITCDPPGTSLNRLVVVGEQISPDPINNTASTAQPLDASTEPASLPSNAPTLWSRLTGWLNR